MRHSPIIATTRPKTLPSMTTVEMSEKGLEEHIPASKGGALQGDGSDSSATTKIEEGEAEAQDDGKEYPGGGKLALIMVALCIAVFLMALEFVYSFPSNNYY